MTTRETFDDVFDDDADDKLINQKDWQKVEKDLKKDGYRDGLDSGQEVTLQTGFNDGYCRAVSLTKKLGHLQGKLSAHLSWKEENKDTDNSSQIESLLKKISQFEKQLNLLVKNQQFPNPEMDSSKRMVRRVHPDSAGDVQELEGTSGCDCNKDICNTNSGNSPNSSCRQINCTAGQREITGNSGMFIRDLEAQAEQKFEEFSAEVDQLLIPS